jgi:hypothetical protein
LKAQEMILDLSPIAHLLGAGGQLQSNPQVLLGVVAVLFAALATIGGIYFFWYTARIRDCRAGVEQLRGSLRDALKSARDDMTTVRQGAADYPASDPLSYRGAAVRLQQIAADADRQYSTCSIAMSHLVNHQITGGDNYLARAWFNLWQARIAWTSYHQAFRGLIGPVDEMRHTLDEGLELVATFDAVCTTTLALELEQKTTVSLKLEELLRNNNVSGNCLDRVSIHLQEQRAVLNSVSTRLGNHHSGSLRPPAEKQKTTEARARLHQIEGMTNRNRRLLQEWYDHYKNIQAAVKQTDQALGRTVKAIKGLPPTIDKGDLMIRFEETWQDYKQLRDWYTGLDTEMFNNYLHRVIKAEKNLDELTWITEEVHRLRQELRDSIIAYHALLSGIEDGMKAGRLVKPYPVHWGKYKSKLLKLDRDLDKIGELTLKRSPTRLAHDAEAATTLLSETVRLRQQVEEVMGQRQEILPLLDRPDLHPSATWPAKARSLQQEAKRYTQRNIPDELLVNRLERDASRLKDLVNRRVPRSSLPAENMDTISANLKRLTTDLDAFHARLAQVAEVLDELDTYARNNIQIVSEQWVSGDDNEDNSDQAGHS